MTMTKAQPKKYFGDILQVDDATTEKLAEKYLELVKKEVRQR